MAFVGEVRGLGGESLEGARWVGIRLDEPVGRNDGCVAVTVSEGDEGEGEVGGGERRTRTEKRRLFECEPNFGVVVRPEKMEVGEQWVPLDDLGVDEDMEEL